MKDLKIALEGWFPLELYDHCQKGLAVFAIIWKSLSGEKVFSSIFDDRSDLFKSG